MSDFAPMPEEVLDRWLADQHHALVNDLAATLALDAGMHEAMILARHAGLVADLRNVLDVEAGLSAIVPATPDTVFEIDPEPWRIEESPSSPGSVAVRRRTRTRTITVLAGLLVLALVAAGIAVGQRQQASLARRIAIAHQLVAQADVARNTDPRTALQLSFAAQRIYPDAETNSNLVNLVTDTRYSSTLANHTSPVDSVAFSPDGITLATASADRTVRLWNVTDPAHPTTLGTPLTGHTNTVNSVAFSPDDKTLATASGDQTVWLWNVSERDRSPQVGQPLIDHVGTVLSVAFSPDGKTLATGNDDGTTRLWNLGGRDDFRDHGIKRACSITKGGLSRDQWAQYIPELPLREYVSGLTTEFSYVEASPSWSEHYADIAPTHAAPALQCGHATARTGSHDQPHEGRQSSSIRKSSLIPTGRQEIVSESLPRRWSPNCGRRSTGCPSRTRRSATRHAHRAAPRRAVIDGVHVSFSDQPPR